MRGQLTPFDIPPGINRQGTDYETRGRWRDCANVRFHQRLIKPRGSPVRTGLDPVNARVCGVAGWVDNSATQTLSIGTAKKLYVTQSELYGTFSDITPVDFQEGRDNSAFQYGYGIGPYGEETYGTPRADYEPITGNVSSAQVWTMHTRGEELYALAISDGRIFKWTPPDTATPAAPLLNAPKALVSVVSPLYHVMAIGTVTDPRQIAWSDNVDPTIWAPDVTNQAGFLQLQDDSYPIAATSFRQGVVIWTGKHAYELQPAPSPFWWRAVRIGEAAGMISPRGFATDGVIVAWMGRKGFWVYDGTRARPLPCEVLDYIYSDLNRLQAFKIVTAHQPEYSEFTWYYPTSESTDNDSFVTWNYAENHWTIGKADVTSYLSLGAFDYNLSWDSLGYTNAEEQSFEDPSYLQSSAFEIANGDSLARLNYFVPDWTVCSPGEMSSTWKVYGKDAPNDMYRQLTDTTLNKMTPPYVDLRGRARLLRVRFDTQGGCDWELGRMRLSLLASGARRP